MCAPRSTFNNYSVKAAITYVSPSETFEAVEAASYSIGATDRCADGYYTHGLGGGAGITDSGPVWLKSIRPHNDLRGVSVVMTGPSSTAGVVAHQTCAR